MLFNFFKRVYRVQVPVLCAIVFVLSCSSVLGQNNVTVQNSVQQENADTLAVTVVTASYKPSATQYSAPLQVISKNDFSELGLKELHEAIGTFSGVQIKDYGGIGGVKSVSVRSMGSMHTAVSYDGVTVSNAQSGQIDIGRFNLSNVETVSLSIGQGDEIFRPARSFASAGLLEIKSAKPDFLYGNVEAGGAVTVSSFNTFNPYMYYNRKLRGEWVFSANADWLVSDGTYPFVIQNGNEKVEEQRLNSDVNTVRAEANLWGKTAGGASISVKGNWLSSQRGLPGSVILYNSNAKERLWDENGFAQISYGKQFSGKWEMQGQLKYNYAWNKYTDEKEYYQDGLLTDRYTQRELYGTVSVKYTPSGKIEGVLSQDVFGNTLDASYDNFVYPRRLTSLTALAGKYEDSRLTVTASLLSTFITEDLKVGQAADDRFRLSPAASVSYKISERHNIRIRASYQDIFRTPTFNDLYYDRVGTRTLKPEIARQLNFGATFRKGFDGIVDEFSVQADGYYNRVRDKIVALPTMFVWKMLNLGKVDIWGSDINMGCMLTFTPKVRLHLQGNYSHMYAVDITDPSGKNYKDQIPYTPRNSGTVTASLLSEPVNVGYVMSVVGERYSLPQNTLQNRMDGYTEHSLSLGRKFALKCGELSLQVECRNFTDVQYEVIQYYPMPGRQYRFTVKFDYK